MGGVNPPPDTHMRKTLHSSKVLPVHGGSTHTCNFDDDNDPLCGFLSDDKSDQIDWTRKSGKTPSGGTGPDKAIGNRQ